MIEQIPEEVKNLIIRKLRHKKREQERQWASFPRTAYKKMHEDILANISCGKVGRAFISVPLGAYREITDSAIAVTREWPGIVWEIISSILDKSHVILQDDQDIHTIVDTFAWGTGKPFTIEFVDPGRFREIVFQKARSYGIELGDIADSFNRQLNLAATQSRCEIINTARMAREGVNIAIDEHLISQEGNGDPEPKETQAQRKQRLKIWFREEVRSGGERGAINRAAKREGISRQRLSIILKRPN